jgi:FAD/FMN-containing dehydrogenase
MATTADLIAGLRDAVGPDNVLTDPDVRRTYETDWTGVYTGTARAVVRPASTAESSAVLQLCAAHRTSVVPQGGNTGLVGGSVPGPEGDAVVLSTARLTAIGEPDPVAGQITVGAGVTLKALQDRLDPHWRPAVDLAARDSATIGGMVATNAGGIHVLRHGTMRRQVAGCEAVLADGRVVSHLNGLEKDNTGYDLSGLLCGSEGTLAVLTRIRLRVIPFLADPVTALLAWPDLRSMVDGFTRLRTELPGLEAAEYVVRRGVDLVQETVGAADPFPQRYPSYLVIEVDAALDEVAAAIERLDGVLDVAVATTPQQRGRLWAIRERQTEALAAAGPPRKLDVTVPVAALPGFVDDAVALVEERPGLTCHHFGHLGDGNVHLNILGAGAEALDGPLLGLATDRGGSISAEHGIGRLKRPWLYLSRSPEEIDAMRRIKQALDPAGLLNPGVLLPA